MRKTLLFAAALCLASTAMAQTYSNPLTANTGENTYDATAPGTIYWTFTADNDYIATLGQYEESPVPNVAIKGGIRPTQIDGVTKSDYTTKVYALEKGKTYYFMLNAEAKGKAGFTLKLDKTENLGVGLSDENPLEIKLGETQVFGNPHYENGNWDNTNVYSTYKAEKDGQLQIKTEQYVSSATVNGTTVSVETVNGMKVFKINTKAGETYAINFNIGIPFFVATSEVVEVKEGSIDMPFALKDGENTVPAEAGKYFFTYQPEHTGYLNISSNSALADGQVAIYRNKLNAAAGTYAQGKSEVGSYNVRAEAASKAYTYYIVVDKKTATDKADNFNFQLENYKAGENPDNPIPVEISDATPTPEITVADKGTYYYSITVPANTSKFLVVESDNDLSAGSSVSLNVGTGTWGATKMENKILKKDVTATFDKTYTLTVTSNETSPLKLKFSYVDIEKGSLEANPKEAVAGENTIDFDNAEFYTYKATKDGKLAITVSGEGEVVFTDPSADFMDTYHKGNVFFADAKAGKTYNIAITGVKKGDTFNLAETEFGAGEIRSTAIEMTGNTYTLGDETANLWIKYTVKKTGIIEFSSDAPFDYDNYDNFIGIAKDNIDGTISMVDQDAEGLFSYQSIFPVTAGEVLYIQVNIQENVAGKKLTLIEREPEVGEALSNPIILKKGETIDVSKATIQKSIWIKATGLDNGKNEFIVTGGSCMPQMNPYLNSDKITYDGGIATWEDIVLSDNTEATAFVIYGSEGTKDYIFRIPQVSGDCKITFGDPTTTGITNVEVASDTKPSIYTIDGRKIDHISGSGVYVIKSNGTTKKVVIKK